MVKFLLECKANPYITSKVDENEEESVLETACRWNYIDIIKLYLLRFAWNKEILKKCLKLCVSENARNEIKQYIKGGLMECICDCICRERFNRKIKTD